MNIALFTSNYKRHKYVANQLAKELSLKLILCEEKNGVIQDFSHYNQAERALLENHFKERELSEEYFFGENISFPKEVKFQQLPFGELNSTQVLKLLQTEKIDCILLFGTSIIKPIILDSFSNKVINLHLGLSPYYKGSGTNFFPIVNEEFECIGATFHLASNQVDGGAILHQLRLDSLDKNDTMHSIGNKVILKAGKIYPKIVQYYLSNKIEPHFQNPYANFYNYRIKDFTPSCLKKAISVILNKGVEKYLEQKDEKTINKPIISNIDE